MRQYTTESMIIFPTHPQPPPPPTNAHIPATPCTGVCRMDDDGLCAGCDRNLDEIAGWSQYDAATRAHIMDEVLPLRRSKP